jgi:hypothetical protein
VALPPGTYRLGPDSATLSVRTERTGAAAKAGHDLLIGVTSWQATLEVGDDRVETRISLMADAGSLRVLQGTGGMGSLGDDDKLSIQETIDEEVLRRQEISFASTHVRANGGGLSVEGDLTLAGTVHPIAFELAVGEGGALTGTAVVTQSRWGMTPYSTLFGTLKVVDEVEVMIEGTLPRVR